MTFIITIMQMDLDQYNTIYVASIFHFYYDNNGNNCGIF